MTEVIWWAVKAKDGYNRWSYASDNVYEGAVVVDRKGKSFKAHEVWARGSERFSIEHALSHLDLYVTLADVDEPKGKEFEEEVDNWV